MDNQEIIFNIILYAGNARSYAMEAIMYAKNKNFEEAINLISKSGEELNNAHKIQTKLIQNEAKGEKFETSLLLIHAQDHLMNAITIKDLASEFIDIYKKVFKDF